MSMSKHPKGLYLLFVTEMWERFSYYGMRAIFILYMTKALVFDKGLSSNIYGSYTGLVYLTPLLGGYIADRYWGNRRSIIVGGFLMAVGQFLMFLSGTFYQQAGFAGVLMYAGLGFLIFGNGFFKPNISTMVGQLYPEGDKRVDAAFTIFYMGINLGAFLSPLVCGALGDTGNPGDFRWGFLAACLGMLFGVFSFISLKDKYIVTPEGVGIGIEPNRARDVAVEGQQTGFSQTQLLSWVGIGIALFLAFRFAAGFDGFGSMIFSGAIAMPGLIISDRSLTATEKDRIWVIYVAAFFVIFFWSAFEQAGASLTFFADEQTDRVVNINTSMGTVYLVISAFAVAIYMILTRLMDTPKEFTWAFRGIGALLLGLIVWGYASGNTYQLPQIPASWFQSVNALAIVGFAPLFSIIWQRLGEKNLEPAAPVKQAIGLLLLALGYVLIAYRVKDLDPSIKVTMFWIIALYVLHTWGELCLSPIGLSMVSKLAPARFASLLMGVWFLANATANKFAGMLSGLYPPGEAEFKKAAEGGVNNLKDILSGAAQATTEQISKLQGLGIPDHYPSFIGFQIHDLFDFFMLFVGMSGLASIILFVLSRRLITMMHGIR